MSLSSTSSPEPVFSRPLEIILRARFFNNVSRSSSLSFSSAASLTDCSSAADVEEPLALGSVPSGWEEPCALGMKRFRRLESSSHWSRRQKVSLKIRLV